MPPKRADQEAELKARQAARREKERSDDDEPLAQRRAQTRITGGRATAGSFRVGGAGGGPASRTRGSAPKGEIEEGSEEGEIDPYKKKPATKDLFTVAPGTKFAATLQKAKAIDNAAAAKRTAGGRVTKGNSALSAAPTPGKKYTLEQSCRAGGYYRLLAGIIEVIGEETVGDDAFKAARDALEAGQKALKDIAQQAAAKRKAAGGGDLDEEEEEEPESESDESQSPVRPGRRPKGGKGAK